MKSKMIKIVLSALLISGSVYAEMSSLDFNELVGLANENAVSLMNLTTKECMRKDGGTCYGLIIDNGSSSSIEVEIAHDWVNRVEIID